MNTVWTNGKIIDGKKVIVLDSDCQFNIDAIKESIQIVNKLKVDYGLLTLWGIEMTINPDDVAEDVLESFKVIMKENRKKKTS
ncbi:hypothetical protein GAG94_03380 [Lysinibacillus sphaericus]|nr:hypothetical protein GAG94_03380 [Lysinibacillus sphaericus]